MVYPSLGFRNFTLTRHTDWKKIEPEIVNLLSDMKQGHLTRLKTGRLKKRWDSFTAKFKEWDQTQALDSHFRPLPLDISVLYPFSTMIYLSDTENAEFEFDDIDRAAKEWIKWRDDFVFSFLPQGLQDRFETDKPLVQSLVIVYFSGRYLPDSLAQKCAKRDYDVSLPADKHGILQVIEQHAFFHAYPWKWSNKELTFDTKAFQIAIDILELLGMDPYTTTLAQMKDCKQKYRCLRCIIIKILCCSEMVSLFIHQPEILFSLALR